MKRNSTLTLSVFYLSFLFVSLTGCGDAVPIPIPDVVEYNVTFDANAGQLADGRVSDTVKVKSGEKVAKPTDPTQDGYTFVEWRKTGATTAFLFTTETITEDITLTAQWKKIILYTVIFDPNQGILANDSSTFQVVAGEKITKPTDPTREGFTFVEWQIVNGSAEGIAFAFTDETITADITLTARWLSNIKHTVIFDANQGMLASSSSTVQISDSEKLPEPQNPTREGFVFIAWQKTDASNSSVFNFNSEIITADITLVAQWGHTVTFTGKSITMSPQVVPEGHMVIQPTTPIRDGYTFVEWQTTANTTFNFETTIIINHITLIAQWVLTIHPLTDIDNSSSPLREWMQLATTEAHTIATNRFFTGGRSTSDRVVMNIDDATFTVFVNPIRSNVNANNNYAITQTGIQTSSDNSPKNLSFASLFGNGITANNYAVVSKDTLYITQDKRVFATIVIDSNEKGLFVKAGEQAHGLLLYSDNDNNPALSTTEWVTFAELPNTGAYEGVSSSSGTIGIGSQLTFAVTSGNIDTIKFAQSDLNDNQISDLRSGTIALGESISGRGDVRVTYDQWPSLSPIIRNIFIDVTTFNNQLSLKYITNDFNASLASIGIASRGGDITVTFLSNRNANTPAQEVTVTYRRPSD